MHRRLLIGCSALVFATAALGSSPATACDCGRYGYYGAQAYGYYGAPAYGYYGAPAYALWRANLRLQCPSNLFLLRGSSGLPPTTTTTILPSMPTRLRSIDTPMLPATTAGEVTMHRLPTTV